MPIFVSAAWLEERLDSPDVLVLDPRRPMRYLQGHLKNAVNLPLSKAFDSEGSLLPAAGLEKWLGAAGLDDRRTVVVYDGHDGRNAAMLAWILEYLGRGVQLLDIFLERWIGEGREIFYRPVKPVPTQFSARVNPQVRAALDDIRDNSGRKLVDFRSREEYAGKPSPADGRPGHIPGAVNVVWQDLVGEDHQFLAPEAKLQELLAAAGIGPRDRVVAYCRTGVRAAVGYLALKRLGWDVVLYDGSYAEWARNGLPVEAS